MPVQGTPAGREKVFRVGVFPEVVAVAISVKMESKSVTDYFNNRHDTDQRLVLGIDGFQLHPWLKLVTLEGGREQSIRCSFGRSPLKICLPEESFARAMPGVA